MIIKNEFAAETVKNAFYIVGVNFDNETGRISRRNLRGVYTLVGGTEPKIFTESKRPQVIITKNGREYVQNGLGICFRANFGRKKIYFYLGLDEGADEWSFYVLKQWGFESKVLRVLENLPLENIVEIMNDTYDELIKSECQGFIPM
jgi:hypothetical protein